MSSTKSVIRSISIVLILLLASFDAALACDSTQTRISTTPVIEQSPVRLELALQKSKEDARGSDLLIVGDSIAFAWKSYVARDFPTKSVFNIGVPGDKTQEVLWRLQNLGPKDLRPKAIVLIIGTNNLGDVSTSVCGVVDGIAAVVAELSRQWPQAMIFVMPILPRGPALRFRENDRRAINGELSKRFAGSPNVLMVSVDEGDMICPMAGAGCPMYQPDMLHLEGSGYQFLRQALGLTSLRALKFDVLG